MAQVFNDARWVHVTGRGWIAVVRKARTDDVPQIGSHVDIDNWRYIVTGVEGRREMTNRWAGDIGIVVRGAPFQHAPPERFAEPLIGAVVATAAESATVVALVDVVLALVDMETQRDTNLSRRTEARDKVLSSAEQLRKLTVERYRATEPVAEPVAEPVVADEPTTVSRPKAPELSAYKRRVWDKLSPLISEYARDKVVLDQHFDVSLDDLGYDSLDRVELSMEIEAKFKIEVPDDKVGDWNTAADVHRFICRNITDESVLDAEDAQ